LGATLRSISPSLLSSAKPKARTPEEIAADEEAWRKEREREAEGERIRQRLAHAREHFRNRGNIPLRHLAALTDGVSFTDKQRYACNQVLSAIRKQSIAVLVGDRGGGKTLIAIHEARILSLSEGMTVTYTTLADWLCLARSTKEAEGHGELEAIRNCSRVDILIIDEAQDRRGTEFADEMFTRLIDARYRNCKPTIIIANLKPSELEKEFGRSIMSRLQEGGVIIQCDGPTMRKAENRPKETT